MSVPTNKVIGNGMVVGLKVGEATNNYAGLVANTNAGVSAFIGSYGNNIGTAQSGGELAYTKSGGLGVTTDATKSGLVVQIDSRTKYIIKY